MCNWAKLNAVKTVLAGIWFCRSRTADAATASKNSHEMIIHIYTMGNPITLLSHVGLSLHSKAIECVYLTLWSNYGCVYFFLLLSVVVVADVVCNCPIRRICGKLKRVEWLWKYLFEWKFWPTSKRVIEYFHIWTIQASASLFLDGIIQLIWLRRFLAAICTLHCTYYPFYMSN